MLNLLNGYLSRRTLGLRSIMTSMLLTAALFAFAGGSASAFSIVGGGADDGDACPSSLIGSCTASSNYEITSVQPATGTIDATANISVSVTSLIMNAVSGNTNLVQKIVFSNLLYTYSGSPGFGLGSVSGSYEQRQSDDTVVVADTPFSFSGTVFFGGVSCSPGLCGFIAGPNGFLLDVDLDAGTTEHAFRHIFNVQVPEPSTALLMASGLLLVAYRRRRV